MFARLPNSIDPYRESERNSQYRGEIPLSQLSRLAPSLLNHDGVVQCEFELFRESGSKIWVKGHLTTTLTLECQRCMMAYQQPLSANFLLRIVKEDMETEAAEAGEEPLIIEDNRLVVLDMIEDEVLLAMPTFPKHEDLTECNWHRPELGEGTALETQNPFAVLEELKKH